MRHQGIKGVLQLEKETSFLFSTTMAPKATPLFHPESNEEADRAIQVVEDAKAHITHLNRELLQKNCQMDVVKAE